VTNTFEKEDEKTTNPKDETTKPNADNGSNDSSSSSGTKSGTSTTGSSGGSSTSSAKLAKTGDPAAATSALMLGLAGIGSALAAGGVAIRNRRREDEDDAC
jgi:LPXTG-motif cell wall-anchored protein